MKMSLILLSILCNAYFGIPVINELIPSQIFKFLPNIYSARFELAQGDFQLNGSTAASIIPIKNAIDIDDEKAVKVEVPVHFQEDSTENWIESLGHVTRETESDTGEENYTFATDVTFPYTFSEAFGMDRKAVEDMPRNMRDEHKPSDIGEVQQANGYENQLNQTSCAVGEDNEPFLFSNVNLTRVVESELTSPTLEPIQSKHAAHPEFVKILASDSQDLTKVIFENGVNEKNTEHNAKDTFYESGQHLSSEPSLEAIIIETNDQNFSTGHTYNTPEEKMKRDSILESERGNFEEDSKEHGDEIETVNSTPPFDHPSGNNREVIPIQSKHAAHPEFVKILASDSQDLTKVIFENAVNEKNTENNAKDTFYESGQYLSSEPSLKAIIIDANDQNFSTGHTYSTPEEKRKRYSILESERGNFEVDSKEHEDEIETVNSTPPFDHPSGNNREVSPIDAAGSTNIYISTRKRSHSKGTEELNEEIDQEIFKSIADDRMSNVKAKSITPEVVTNETKVAASEREGPVGFDLYEFIRIIKSDRNVQAYLLNKIILYCPALVCDILLWMVIAKLIRNNNRPLNANVPVALNRDMPNQNIDKEYGDKTKPRHSVTKPINIRSFKYNLVDYEDSEEEYQDSNSEF